MWLCALIKGVIVFRGTIYIGDLCPHVGGYCSVLSLCKGEIGWVDLLGGRVTDFATVGAI